MPTIQRLTPDHRTFKSDLYEQVVQRHRRTRIVQLREIDEKLSLAESDPSLIAVIEEFRAQLQAQIDKWPPPTWESAIGLGVSAEVSDGDAKHHGTYTLIVDAADTLAGYVVTATGPEGSVEYYPGCGFSETEASVRIGGWRHTLTRIFGLAAKGKA